MSGSYPAATNPLPVAAVASLGGLLALSQETTGDSRVTIAVVDGPIDRANACLAGAVIDQFDIAGTALLEEFCSFRHGTEIASIIFGQHYTAVPGIAPKCRGVSIPVFDCFPADRVAAAQHDLAQAIDRAREFGAMVVNISAGASGDGADRELVRTVEDCARSGVLIVAAAGNDGCNCLHVPAALPSVLSVGAMTSTGRPLSTSNWGAAYQESGILAPGQNIPVATARGDVALRTGTSYATAIVTGIIGLLLSRELRLGRPARPFLIRDALLSTAFKCDDAETDRRRCLAGRLNIPGAISYLDRWSTPMTDELQTDLPNQSTVESESTFNNQVSPLDGETQSRPDDPRNSMFADSLRWPSADSSSGVEPSACSACRGGRPLVYAMGQLGYDFGTEAALDAFRQRMRHELGQQRGEPNPLNEKQLLRFFRATKKEPWHHTGLSWTLNQSGSPIYVIEPEGPFADRAYQRLLKCFKEQYRREADRVAVPGVITGRKRLLNGMTVDVIDPDLRGLCNWNRQALIEALFRARGEQQGLTPEQQEELNRFLDRIYHELQNLGVRPEHRALNYAGTNLFQVGEILSTRDDKRTLDTIHAEPSQVCRPGSDCWDIVLSFFNPDQLQPVSKIYRYTVDVSFTIPVTVGAIRSWEVRSR